MAVTVTVKGEGGMEETRSSSHFTLILLVAGSCPSLFLAVKEEEGEDPSFSSEKRGEACVCSGPPPAPEEPCGRTPAL